MINTDELKARVYHGLKTNSLSSENWEEVICHSMSADWVPGDKYLADGILDQNILNIKTLGFKPVILKTKESRDFLSDPTKFSPTNQMMIQRRTNLPVELDEQTSTPKQIGSATLKGFEDFVQESYQKFSGTNNVLDVVVRHGIDHTENRYLVDVDIFDHHFYSADDLDWQEVMGGPNSRQKGKRVAVEGYLNGNIVARRNGSNSGLYQTNYLIYKDLTKSKHNYTISIPRPDQLDFNKTDILNEIKKVDQKIHF